MQRTKLLFFLFFILSKATFSQVSLHSSINNSSLPHDSDLIVTPNPYIDTSGLFVSSGFQVGDTVNDFTLYDTLGNATTLSGTLDLGKPVLLVSVSLSCPSSRHSMSFVLGDIYAQYGSHVNILLVYIIEAHPVTPDPSPYSGTVWTTLNNYQDSILIRQEAHYLQRKSECANFVHRFTPPVPILVDDPGNNYWLNFGPAPNNAYLILPDGTVYRKYGWFDRSKLLILSDIAGILNPAGISPTTINSSAAIFPNPSNGNSNLVVENESSYNFRIIDMQGRIIAEEQNETNSVADLEKYNLDAGVYSVMVEGKSGRVFNLRYILN
jgi:hypothetical protein